MKNKKTIINILIIAIVLVVSYTLTVIFGMRFFDSAQKVTSGTSISSSKENQKEEKSAQPDSKSKNTAREVPPAEKTDNAETPQPSDENETVPVESTENTKISDTEQFSENQDGSNPENFENSDESVNGESGNENLPEHLMNALKKENKTESDLEQLNCQQLIIVEAAGTSANISFYEKDETGVWSKEESLSTEGSVGREGVGTASEDLSKTPEGLYAVGEAFYIDSEPTTGLKTFQITDSTNWISDPDSQYYNKRVEGTENQDWDSAKIEHMIDYYDSYHYGFVIEYNTTNIVPGAGSAFFFHCVNSPTAGCVAVSEDMVLAYLGHLSADKNPYILIENQ